MGSEFEVWAWVPYDIEIGDNAVETGYRYVQKYSGEDYDEAMKIAKQLKEEGVGCVKIEWR